MQKDKIIAIYCRVAHMKPDSPYFQYNSLLAYAKNKNYQNCEIYYDCGFHGITDQRPELQRMLKDIRDGRISMVVVQNLDRLSRDRQLLTRLIEKQFKPYGVKLDSMDGASKLWEQTRMIVDSLPKKCFREKER